MNGWQRGNKISQRVPPWRLGGCTGQWLVALAVLYFVVSGFLQQHMPELGSQPRLWLSLLCVLFAAVFGNACFKSVRRKREYRECKRMLAKLKRVGGRALLLGRRLGGMGKLGLG